MKTEFDIGNSKNVNIAYTNISNCLRGAYGPNVFLKGGYDEETGEYTWYPAYKLVPDTMYESLTVKIIPEKGKTPAKVVISLEDETDTVAALLNNPDTDPDTIFNMLSDSSESEESDPTTETENTESPETNPATPVASKKPALTEDDYKKMLEIEYQTCAKIIPAHMGIY